MTTTARSLIRGSDDIGRFVMSAGICFKCKKHTACIKYAPKSASLANWNIVSPESTTIKSWDNRLGVPCGCYAKFQRQLAHIFDKTEGR